MDIITDFTKILEVKRYSPNTIKTYSSYINAPINGSRCKIKKPFPKFGKAFSVAMRVCPEPLGVKEVL